MLRTSRRDVIRDYRTQNVLGEEHFNKRLLICCGYRIIFRDILCIFTVTPLAGVWIEIPGTGRRRGRVSVTPLAGVWIEIKSMRDILTEAAVTPLAGVWIEMKCYHLTG